MLAFINFTLLLCFYHGCNYYVFQSQKMIKLPLKLQYVASSLYYYNKTE